MAKPQTNTSEKQKEARKELYNLYCDHPLMPEEILVNLGLFIRSSCLAKILYLNELYEQIVDLPGVIMEFGSWYGQNLVLFSNLRAIYEPYNYTRKVIGFDMFNVGPDENFRTPENYEEYLIKLLNYHEKENVLDHIQKYEIIKGDLLGTLPTYLYNNPRTLVALAYLDVQEYEPTAAAIFYLLPKMVPNGIIAFDELNNKAFTGETLAYQKLFKDVPHTIKRSRYLPDRSYVICKNG